MSYLTLGLSLLAWRGESGKSYVADSYCKYLATNLSTDGTVNGECIDYSSDGFSFSGPDEKLNSFSAPIPCM